MSGNIIESSLGDDSILAGAHSPVDPVLEEAARFITRHDAADLLPMMQLTPAERAVNADRWAAFVEAAPSEGGAVA